MNATINIPQHTHHAMKNSGEILPYKGTWEQLFALKDFMSNYSVKNLINNAYLKRKKTAMEVR